MSKIKKFILTILIILIVSLASCAGGLSLAYVWWDFAWMNY
jgi:hypothetical protein